MLLIHPPVAKPSEPPAGLARLAGALQRHGVSCTLLDANCEALLWLISQHSGTEDTWTRRAAKHHADNCAALRHKQTYSSFDRYSKAVREVNRLLAMNGKKHGVALSLADFQMERFSPVKSADLLAAAASPELNPFYDWFSRRLPEVMEGSVATVGFSLNYLSQAVCTFAMAGFLRQVAPELKILLGGGLVTSWCSRPDWRNPFAGLFDELIAGPGEARLLAHAGVATENSVAALPDYSLLPLSDYLSPGLILPYSASSGCYWNHCSFCPEQAEGNNYHPLPVSSVLSQLQGLADRYRPSLIHLLDNAVSPLVLQGLAEHPPGPPWYGFARIEEILTDQPFCIALRQSGCVMLKLGLESGDQQVLDQLGKGIKLERTEKVLDNLRQAGIASYVYLLFGTPAEDEAAARRTLAFVRRQHDKITFLNLAIFNMPIGSSEAETLGIAPFYPGDLSLYTAFNHPHPWERHKVRRFLQTEFTRDPLVTPILRRDPPIFTSNHAPFFTTAPLL